MILCLDQGTTGTTVLLLDPEGAVVAQAYREIPQHFPRPGWVEHDPEAIWQSVLDATAEVLARAEADLGHPPPLSGLGITNQRETVVAWDRQSLQPAGPALVWQDRRTAALCAELEQAGHGPEVRRRTGLVIDPYFSGSKLTWMFAADPGLAAAAGSGALAVGTVDSWLIARLTSGRVHATDPSNASRTLLFNLDGDWDQDLLDLFGVPRACLPRVLPSSGSFGSTDPDAFLGLELPIAGVAGDQQAALFGQACFEPGMAKNTFGTGSFVLVNTGTRRTPTTRCLTTVAWDLGRGLVYALEGSVFVSGATMQWLRDGLGLIGSAAESEAACRSVPDCGGVVLVPAFAGLGAPHWDPHARGLIVGLTRGTTAAHLVRAGIEAMAHQTRDVLEAMEEDSGVSVPELRVDGGASANDFLLQFQADLLGRVVRRPRVVETTAMGAGFLAGLGVGTWASTAEVAATWRQDRAFSPGPASESLETGHRNWRRAVALSRGWAAPEAQPVENSTSTAADTS